MPNNSTDSTPALSLTDYPAYIASEWIWKVCSPILILMGTIGNVLSIIVLTRKNMRESTVSIYLTMLSVMDILVLYTGLLRQWLREVIKTDVRELSELSCKIHTWMVYSSLDISVWLLVSVTVERFVSVWFPHKVKQLCNKLIAFIIICIVSAILLAINSHFLYGLGTLHETTNGMRTVSYCDSLWNNYDHFQTKVFPWIDLCFFSLLPFTVLIVANISIIYKVISSRRKACRVNPVSITTSQQVQVRSKKISSMTNMLLVLNFVFFVCTVPISVFLIGEPYFWVNTTTHQDANLHLIWALVNIFMYTNNSINFLLYCLSGSRFRDTLKRLIFRESQLRPRNSMTVMRTNVAVIDPEAPVNLNRVGNSHGNGYQMRSKMPKISDNEMPTTLSTLN